MAQALKILIQSGLLGDSIWSTDKTGEYDVTSNPGGWGTPNPDLAKSCLVAIAQRKGETTTLLSPVGSNAIYDNTAANSEEKVFEFKYSNDGYHTITHFRLPVSADAVNDLDANALSAGDFFWNSVTGKVSKLVTTSPLVFTEVTDYQDLLADTTLTQVSCDQLFMNKLKIESDKMYREYMLMRNDKGECPEVTEAYLKYSMFSDDIKSCFNAFWSGLATQAQNVVDSLLKKHGLQ